MKFEEQRIADICKWLEENHPKKDCDFYKIWLSIDILRVLIGNDWTNQSIFPNIHPTSSKAVQDAIKFLRTKEISHHFQERVSKLAIRLYNIQSVLGFEKVVNEILFGDIYGGYAEIEAGDFFMRRNVYFEFVIPTGKKGKDFDIRINTTPSVNCEVKHKIESTEPGKDVLESTLSLANKQVPHNEPALFFIKIPEEWVCHKDFRNIVERVKGTFCSRNRHVVGFILHWEEKFFKTEGIFFWKYTYEENNFCSINTGDISKQLKVQVDPMDIFVQMLSKYVKKCQHYPSNV